MIRMTAIAALIAVTLTVAAMVQTAAAAEPTGAAGPAAGVAEPSGYRTTDYRAPVPATLSGAVTMRSADEAKAAMDRGAVFIDVYPRAPKPPGLPASTVWREPPHRSIAGAHWLANVGYGAISPETEAYYTRELARLTGGDMSKPIVVFCLRDCWMSWNAAKRAVALGYRNVLWYPDGTDGWAEWGLPVTNLTPVP
jgi:PQQ-dependent catabolism-associated CXXCW motif protein